jgi:hypothetical protein
MLIVTLFCWLFVTVLLLLLFVTMWLPPAAGAVVDNSLPVAAAHRPCLTWRHFALFVVKTVRQWGHVFEGASLHAPLAIWRFKLSDLANTRRQVSHWFLILSGGAGLTFGGGKLTFGGVKLTFGGAGLTFGGGRKHGDFRLECVSMLHFLGVEYPQRSQTWSTMIGVGCIVKPV